MTSTQERIAIERHLSYVIGESVSLRAMASRPLDPSALKKAYYRRAKELHPDRASFLGLDPAVQTERFRILQASWEAVVASLDSGHLARLLREPIPPGTGPAGPARPSGYARGGQGTEGCGSASKAYHAASAYRDSARGARQGDQHGRAPHGPHQGNGWQGARGRQSGAGYGRQADADWRYGQAGTGGQNGQGRQDRAPGRKGGILYAGNVPAFELRFAEWLYYTRKIDFETLIESLVWQYTVRPKVGTIAVSLDYLDRNEVDSVLTRRRPGERFCDAAVRLGYLDEYARAVVMGRQRLMNLPIGSFFEDRGILSPGDAEAVVRDLWAHNAKHRPGARFLKR